MRRGYFTPPVLIILAIIIFAVAILIALNTDLVKRIKKEPLPSPIISPSPASGVNREPNGSAEIVNWKTYKGSDFKVEFRYPDAWSIKTEKKEVVVLSSPNKNVLLIRDTLISLVGDIPTLDSYVDQTIQLEKQLGNTLKSRENIVLGNNTPGILWIIQTPERLTKTTSFEHNNHVYEITLTASSEAQMNDLQGIYDQILSTFRFLE